MPQQSALASVIRRIKLRLGIKLTVSNATGESQDVSHYGKEAKEITSHALEKPTQYDWIMI